MLFTVGDVVVIGALVGIHAYVLGNFVCRWLFQLPPFEVRQQTKTTKKTSK